MARYPHRQPGTDAYAVSRTLLDALITRVGDAKTAGRAATRLSSRSQ